MWYTQIWLTESFEIRLLTTRHKTSVGGSSSKRLVLMRTIGRMRIGAAVAAPLTTRQVNRRVAMTAAKLILFFTVILHYLL